MGEEVTGRYRNVAGGFWSTLAGAPIAPLEPGASLSPDSVFEASRPEVGTLFVAEAAIRGTPWAIVLELPTKGVLARTRATMLRLSTLSLLLVAVGAVASWIISKRITRPLATLSGAAEALAHGDVTRPVDDTGGDEVAQLARTFNHMRDEIASARAELEAQVEEAQSATEELELANEQLHHAMEAAETANRAKSDFLAVMSHELRTPLNAIGGYVELLQLGVHGPLSEPQQDALGRVARSQQRLLTLINDVLNFAKLDAGHVDYNWSDFPLDGALSALEPLIAPQVRAKGLTYTYASCDPSLTVHADHDRLQQVVLNLLSNAVKFTPDGGGIVVYCDTTSDADAVLVNVRDTGLGIPPDRLRTIFEPFVQVDRSLNRPHEGIGLGLSISRELARGMGGDLTVTSEVGKGSVFTVKVWRSRPPSLGGNRVAWTSVTPERTAAARPGRA
jgi:signal transduction histidine kinase